MNTYIKIFALAGSIILCHGCDTQTQPTSGGHYQEYEQPDTAGEIQEMRDYHYSARVECKNLQYAYDIVREVNDSLPVVTDENGERFADNYIRLRVNKNDRQIFNKVFTKASFSEFLNEDFKAHSILEGMAFDRVVDNGLRFAVSISYPLSDIYIPLLVTVSPEGSYQITKDEILDTIVEKSDSTEQEE